MKRLFSGGWAAVLLFATASCGGQDASTTGALLLVDLAVGDIARLDAALGCGMVDPQACDPQDTHKTTLCHVPPGNPANAHTLCVGNAATGAHLAHGDHLGSCNHTSCGEDGGSGQTDAGMPDLGCGMHDDFGPT